VGIKDTITKKYMSDNRIFAYAFNKFIYNGKQVIKPENLRQLDTTLIEVPYGISGENSPLQKVRDDFKAFVIMEDETAIYAMLGIENQSEIHYAMPVKNMLYDAVDYANQVSKTAKTHRKNKDKSPSNAEYLSGFYRTDKLVPVITLTIYFGAEKWEAPRSIYDMFSDSVNEKIRSLAENYKINLIVPNEMSDSEIDEFKTSLREVIKFIKYSKDKKKISDLVQGDMRFLSLERSAVDVINICTDSDLKVADNAEVVDMCQAIKDIREDGAIERATKIALNLLKMGKNSLEDIAEATGLSLNEINKLKASI